jgi:hypothetical protein
VNHSQFAKPSSHVLVDKEYTILKPLCGLKNMKPTLKMTFYTPFRDLHNGDITLAWPLDFEVYPIWLEQIVMLSKMKATSITKWCMCNGGCC